MSGAETGALPRHALSVRQPWASAIVHLGKSVENRSWRRPNPGLEFRGPVCIHAAKGMTRAEYEEAAEFIRSVGGDCPLPDALPRGGIIGVATVIDVVRQSDSPWFFGPVGLVLADARSVPFVGAGGQLGFFEWKPHGEGPDAPAKWMSRYGDPAELAREEIERGLF